MREGTLRTLNEQVDPEHTALLIIDPQKDFCASSGALAEVTGVDVSRIQDAVPRLNALIQKAREAGLTIVWTRVVLASDKMRPSQKAVWGEGDDIWIVREGSDGIEWYSEIVEPLADEHVITKWHYDAFEDTDLDSILQNKGIKTLLVAGFTTNVCVETTARRGYTKGYYVVLVSDCTDAPSEQEYESAVFNIGLFFGQVASSDKISQIWASKEGRR